MRLVTRADFDGVSCGALLVSQGLIDDTVFVHPKDLQDGYFLANKRDVLCNVPFVEGCGMWFDHHTSELERTGAVKSAHSESRLADSCARIIYEHFGGEKVFPWATELMEAVDRVDSGKLTMDDILDPKRWVLIGFIADPRTGLGRFRHFRLSHYQMMLQFIERTHRWRIDQILDDADIQERIAFYHSQSDAFQQMVRKHTRIVDNIIVTDLRGVETIYVSNRFTVYGMYPEQNVSLWITPTKGDITDSIACGYSILNRTCRTDIGKLMASHGGGGHRQVGTCQIVRSDTDQAIEAIVKSLQESAA